MPGGGLTSWLCGMGEAVQVRTVTYIINNVYMCTYCNFFGIESEVNVPFKDLLQS